MVGTRKRGAEIRRFILDNVEQHPQDIAKLTAHQFGISRQAVNKHLRRLVVQEALGVQGGTRDRQYHLPTLLEWTHGYPLTPSLEEDVVWRSDITPRLGELPGNVLAIWNYGFTEILNNAIDHSAGTTVTVRLKKSASTSELMICDDGEGIFRKIQRELGLQDERHAVLEVAKGKLTTDPKRHTGEGIFFTSRMFDEFGILSGHVFLSRKFEEVEDWIVESQKDTPGTVVVMKLKNTTRRTAQEVFANFTSGEDYGFTKTVVPVRLAQYGDETLISRSQAKRLLARFEKFRVVVLDFQNVDTIGPAFADEVFRVFPLQHPEIEIVDIHATSTVQKMISRAKAHPKP